MFMLQLMSYISHRTLRKHQSVFVSVYVATCGLCYLVLFRCSLLFELPSIADCISSGLLSFGLLFMLVGLSYYELDIYHRREGLPRIIRLFGYFWFLILFSLNVFGSPLYFWFLSHTLYQSLVPVSLPACPSLHH